MRSKSSESPSSKVLTVITMGVLAATVPPEVMNRVDRLQFAKASHPLLNFITISERDLDESGHLRAQAQARLENFLDIYWDWTLGDRHQQSVGLVVETVWKNYLNALKQVVPGSFLPADTRANMAMDRLVNNGRMIEFD